MVNVQYNFAKNIAKINCIYAYFEDFYTNVFLCKWPSLKIAYNKFVLVIYN